MLRVNVTIRIPWALLVLLWVVSASVSIGVASSYSCSGKVAGVYYSLLGLQDRLTGDVKTTDSGAIYTYAMHPCQGLNMSCPTPGASAICRYFTDGNPQYTNIASATSGVWEAPDILGGEFALSFSVPQDMYQTSVTFFCNESATGNGELVFVSYNVPKTTFAYYTSEVCVDPGTSVCNCKCCTWPGCEPLYKGSLKVASCDLCTPEMCSSLFWECSQSEASCTHGNSALPETIQLCACGESPCAGRCTKYPLDLCAPLYDSCTDQPTGHYVLFSKVGSTYYGSIFTDFNCANFYEARAAPCGTCIDTLQTEVKCQPGSSSNLDGGAIAGIVIGSLFGTMSICCCVGCGIGVWYWKKRGHYQKL